MDGRIVAACGGVSSESCAAGGARTRAAPAVTPRTSSCTDKARALANTHPQRAARRAWRRGHARRVRPRGGGAVGVHRRRQGGHVRAARLLSLRGCAHGPRHSAAAAGRRGADALRQLAARAQLGRRAAAAARRAARGRGRAAVRGAREPVCAALCHRTRRPLPANLRPRHQPLGRARGRAGRHVRDRRRRPRAGVRQHHRRARF